MGDERVRWLRKRATELRKLADGLNREADALEALSDPPVFGGARLRDEVVLELQAVRAVGPHHRGMYYRELLDRIEERTGGQVRGVDPAATLLSNLDRDPRIESAQSRSGRYRLVFGYEQAVMRARRRRPGT